MSVIVGNGMWLSYDETELVCPICSGVFDASEKMAKAKLPVFKMKCPRCKGFIGVKVAVFGSQNTKCFEWDPPKGQHVETETEFKVNGKSI